MIGSYHVAAMGVQPIFKNVVVLDGEKGGFFPSITIRGKSPGEGIDTGGEPQRWEVGWEGG